MIRVPNLRIGLLTLLIATGTLHAQPPAKAPNANAHPKTKGMVVVAPAKFYEALKDYMSFRSDRRPAKLVALETILKESDGVDDPERLKHWLYREWKENGVGYVLLVGDADLVPVRYMVLDRVTPRGV